MKHYFLSAMVVLMSAFAVVSCKDDDDAVAASISADQTSVTYDFTRSVQRLDVSATVDWTATTNVSWIHLTKTAYDANEDRVMFIVDENPTKDSRQGNITVSCSGGSVIFTITQDGGHAVDVPTKHYDITSEGGTLKITMSANTEVEVNVTEGADWLTFVEIKGMGTQFPYMIFNAEVNDNEDERYATVKVKEKGTADDQAITLTMTQKEKDIFTPEGGTEYEVKGSERKDLTFDFATNVSYLESISDPSWIIPVKEEPAETKTNSVKSGQLKYTILQSTEYEERVGTITIVKYGTETELVKFTVTQSGNDTLSVYKIEGGKKVKYKDKETINVESNEKFLNMILEHNWPANPIASSDGSWASFTPSVDGFTLKVVENNSSADRTATLTFSDPNGKAKPVEFTIKQAGNPILSVDPTFIASIANGITADAKVFNVKVTHNLPKDPKAESSAAWARFSKSVDGFTLTVDKNDSGADRTATLTFSDPNGKAKPVKLTLKQKK